MRFRPRPFTIVVLAGAFMGLSFASVSTYDFVMHLDRQVHDVHCSFVPVLSGTESGTSGCQVTLVSPYSSVLRTAVWGGVPISLPAMGVFAFLLFFALELVLSNRQDDRRATGFLALATGLPAVTSLLMGYLSLVELDTACKLCIGIYIA
ncbi:MAG TPA: vitamin K epoxide reductase family protein, partial [Haliangium sp.]|nr:vitamin K epoxide reductase family protein [Haliangium sp.]